MYSDHIHLPFLILPIFSSTPIHQLPKYQKSPYKFVAIQLPNYWPYFFGIMATVLVEQVLNFQEGCLSQLPLQLG